MPKGGGLWPKNGTPAAVAPVKLLEAHAARRYTVRVGAITVPHGRAGSIQLRTTVPLLDGLDLNGTLTRWRAATRFLVLDGLTAQDLDMLVPLAPSSQALSLVAPSSQALSFCPDPYRPASAVGAGGGGPDGAEPVRLMCRRQKP